MMPVASKWTPTVLAQIDQESIQSVCIASNNFYNIHTYAIGPFSAKYSNYTRRS